MSSDSISDQVRIVLDGNLLSDKYKLEPHADSKAGYGRGTVDESEERISTVRYPKGVDISKCIIRVDVKQPMVVGAGKFQDQDDEDFIEPPFISKYNKQSKPAKPK